MGYSGAQFDPEKVDLFFESEAGKHADHRERNGGGLQRGEGYRDPLPSRRLRQSPISKKGEESAAAWGCDLTHEYININADYRS